MDDSMGEDPAFLGFNQNNESAHSQAQSLPTSPYYRSESPQTYQPPHYLPHLGSNLAGSPPSFDSPRFISSNSLFTGSNSPELEMRMTPPPEATFGRVEFNDRSQTSSHNFLEIQTDLLMNSIPRGKPGYKITMGYRADCAECLAHKPGHYQHLSKLE